MLLSTTPVEGAKVLPLSLTTDVSPDGPFNRFLKWLPGAHADVMAEMPSALRDAWAKRMIEKATLEGLL